MNDDLTLRDLQATGLPVIIFEDDAVTAICDRCGDEIDLAEANYAGPELPLWEGATLCNDCYAAERVSQPQPMTLTITKQVPAHVRTETAEWCIREFQAMSPTFRRIRSGRGDLMDKCYWCEHVFIDGEMMALAHFVGKTNKVLCQSCAHELLNSLRDDET